MGCGSSTSSTSNKKKEKSNRKAKEAANVGLSMNQYSRYNYLLKSIDQYHRQLRCNQIDELILIEKDTIIISALNKEKNKLNLPKKKHSKDSIISYLNNLIKICQEFYQNLIGIDNYDRALAENCMITIQKLSILLNDLKDNDNNNESKDIDIIKKFLIDVKKGYTPIHDISSIVHTYNSDNGDNDIDNVDRI